MLGLEYRIKDLESDDKELSIPLSREHLSDALGDFEPNLDECSATISGTLSKQSSVVQCDGWLRGQLALACQRCLEPTRLPLDVRLHTLYTPAGQGAGEPTEASDEDVDDDDLDYAHHNGETVDLWPVVRESMILAVPITVLCKEDCRGLCPSCGVDRNTTECSCKPAAPLSPFAALKDLKLPT